MAETDVEKPESEAPPPPEPAKKRAASKPAPPKPLPPGSTIGILGGGQLGRMTALAAARLGYRSHVFSPEKGGPAHQVTAYETVAAYEDEAALDRFAGSVDVVTLEFENVPVSALERLARKVPVRPGAKVLSTCQNRLAEKDFCRACEIPTTRYGEVSSAEAVARMLRDLGTPGVLKTLTHGYDGKGQALIRDPAQAVEAWDKVMKGRPGESAVLEAWVDFRLETSVIVARGVDGSQRCYPPVENQHRDGILEQTIVPARLPPGIADRAEAIARRLAERFELIGLLAVEMFLSEAGELLVNELAPRPHNSGHWTLDAAVTSQFEQLVRAIAGLPLGSSEPTAGAVMKNLIGDEVEGWNGYLSDAHARLHLYGKDEIRPGRKMGHVTRLTTRH